VKPVGSLLGGEGCVKPVGSLCDEIAGVAGCA